MAKKQTVAKKVAVAKPKINADSLKAEVSYRLAQKLDDKASQSRANAKVKGLVSKSWAAKENKKSAILKSESDKALSTFNKITGTKPRDVKWLGKGHIQTPDAKAAISKKFPKKK